jgi:gamma-glutamyltranspeptidase/glutathione hydrolase
MGSRVSALLGLFALGAAGLGEAQPMTARYAVRGLRGAVAGGSDAAVEAAMRAYYLGGNAVDAGVAATFAASVAEFSHFGFGGEAPILVRTPDGRVHSIAGVGTMPRLASAELFRKRKLRPEEVLEIEPGGMPEFLPSVGLMAALVPGMVDAALLALKQFGTLRAAQVMAPALELAEGMALDETRARSIAQYRAVLMLWPTSAAVFLPGGRLVRPGEILRQPDLARTMRSMATAEAEAIASGAGRAEAIEAVRDYFYRGEIARRIDAFSRAQDGLLRYEDLASFRLRPEEPVSGAYRGYEIHKPGFWSQGPVLIQLLNMLEGAGAAKMGHNSADYIHHVTEAIKLAYADRDTYYGDPQFVSVPAELLDKGYAARRRELIGARASLEFRPGEFGGGRSRHPSEARAAPTAGAVRSTGRDTTCVAAIDRAGFMFAATPSGAWMPPVIAGDTGIPLTQRAQSFFLLEGHPNEVTGGKRPRITLSPTLVTRAGRPLAVLATPGGDNQDQAMLQLLLNVIEFGMSTQAAVEAPRFQSEHLVASFDNHPMKPGVLLLDERIPAKTAEQLRELGHQVDIRSRWASGAAPVMIRVLPSGVIEAAADPYGHRTARAW